MKLFKFFPLLVLFLICLGSAFSVTTYYEQSINYTDVTNGAVFNYGGTLHGGWTTLNADKFAFTPSSSNFNRGARFSIGNTNISTNEYLNITFDNLQTHDRWNHISFMDSSNLGFAIERVTFTGTTERVAIREINTSPQISFGSGGNASGDVRAFYDTTGFKDSTATSYELLFNGTHAKVTRAGTLIIDWVYIGKTLNDIERIDVFTQGFSSGSDEIQNLKIVKLEFTPVLQFDTINVNNENLTNNSFFNSTELNFSTFVTSNDNNTNINQTYFLYNSTGLQAASQFATNNVNGSFQLNLTDGEYKISFYAENDKNNVITQNYTFLVDTTPPTINNSLPLEINSYNLGNLSDYVSCSDIGINGICQVQFQPDNVTYNVTDNVTFTFNGNQSYIITAQDEAGNKWEEQGIIFVNPLERFNIIDQDSNPVFNFTFGGTFYNTSYAEFPLYDLGLGSHTLSFSKGGFNPKNFTFTFNTTSNFNLTYSVNYAIINVTIYDRLDDQLLLNNVTITLVDVVENTTNTGNIVFSGGDIPVGTYRIEAVSDGFYTEARVFEYTAERDVNIDFYLLNLTQSNSASLFVQVFDEFDNIITQADVKLQEYDPSILGFREVSQCRSNSNGECQFLIEQSTKTYRIEASKLINGILFSADSGEGEIFLPEISGGEEVLGGNIVRNLYLRISPSIYVTDFEGLTISLPENEQDTIIFQNESLTTIEIPVSFSTSSNQNVEVCIEFYLTSGGRLDEIRTPICTSGSSGVLPVEQVNLNNEFDYEIRVSIEQDNNKILYKSYEYISENSFIELLRNQLILNPFILLLWVVLLGVSIGLKSLGVWSIGSIVLAVVQMSTFFNIIFVSANIIIILINLGVLYISRKQIDTI